MWRRYLIHLRLPFNLLLSPIYLWGVLLGGGAFDRDFWLAYVALHLFLYGGTTAFNSYFDRDEGPVGGLLVPPPVDVGLLRFSLVVQALGLLLALFVGASFTVAWLALFVIATAYSHPKIRLKANPGQALLAVGVGQGCIGFAAGWLVAEPALASLLTPAALLGMLSTGFTVTGLYLVTQAYQTHEDRRRGDRTLPVLLGPRRALLVAVALLALGGLLLVPVVFGRFGGVWLALLTGFFALVAGGLLGWARRFVEAEVTANYRSAMRLASFSAIGFGMFALIHLLSS